MKTPYYALPDEQRYAITYAVETYGVENVMARYKNDQLEIMPVIQETAILLNDIGFVPISELIGGALQ